MSQGDLKKIKKRLPVRCAGYDPEAVFVALEKSINTLRVFSSWQVNNIHNTVGWTTAVHHVKAGVEVDVEFIEAKVPPPVLDRIPHLEVSGIIRTRSSAPGFKPSITIKELYLP